MTTVLVTGAGGLLGSHLIALLANSAEHRVIASTSRAADAIRALWVERGADRGSAADVEIVFTDEVAKYVTTADLDWLVNCSFPRNLGGSELARGLDFHDNMFAAAAEGGTGAVINVSSQSVYPSSRQHAVDEQADLDLDTPYATAKYATEVMLRSAFTGQPYMNARLASLIAPDFDQRIANKLVKRALAGKALKITASEQVFDFMDVRDAARALETIVRTGIVAGTETLNVGAGQPISLGDLARDVVDVVARDTPLTVECQVDGPPSSALDNSLLMRSYRFAPAFSMRDSLRDIVAAAGKHRA